MSEAAATDIWLAFSLYCSFGLALACFTLAFNLKRIEPGAAQMPWRVRALILPGLVLLWPLVVVRLAGVKPKEDRP